MKKVMKLVASLLVVMITATMILSNVPEKVNAAGTYHRSNVSTASNGNLMVAVDGTYDNTSVTDILNLINQYRYEACNAGNVPDPNNRNRMLAPSDYVPIQWSNLLEEMAMLRSAEGSVNYNHTRPNGTDCWTASYGVSSWNEVLAWYGGLLSGIGGWYEEKSDWVNQTGAVTGHYTAMINPSNRYCAVACFNGCAAGEFTSTTSALDQTKIDVSQYCGQYFEVRGNKVTDYSFSGDSRLPYVNGRTSLNLTVTITDINAWGSSVTKGNLRVVDANWVSSNPSVAIVDRSGLVTTQGITGSSTISLTFGSNTITHTVTAVNGVDMHRLYNPNSGEHFYTGNTSERDNLISVGWRYEGVAWTAPLSGNPVYRMYNRYTGDHHYTINYTEVQNLVGYGWTYEGVGWYTATNTGVPLYRLYNPYCTGAGSHHYTINASERNDLISRGWRDEGIGWYGV